MKVRVGTCKQCRAAKKRVRSSTRKRVKRILNKKRRRTLRDTKYYSWYWA